MRARAQALLQTLIELVFAWFGQAPLGHDNPQPSKTRGSDQDQQRALGQSVLREIDQACLNQVFSWQ